MGLLDSMRQSLALRGLPKIGVSDPVCPYCYWAFRAEASEKEKVSPLWKIHLRAYETSGSDEGSRDRQAGGAY